ncbi:hypothetical protein ACU8KH_04097 [Lachancea thermotolerans]
MRSRIPIPTPRHANALPGRGMYGRNPRITADIKVIISRIPPRPAALNRIADSGRLLRNFLKRHSGSASDIDLQ